MNWQKIKTKYLNADRKFSAWMETRAKEMPFDFGFSTRDLYDFFDAQGIRLFVSLADNGGEFLQGNANEAGRIIEWSDKTFKSRIDAEYKAFEKGFELLEKKLKS